MRWKWFGGCSPRSRTATCAISSPAIPTRWRFTRQMCCPYGGIWRGREGAVGHAVGFMRSWAALQGPGERVLGARFWGDGAGTVCVLFRHRAVDPVGGGRFDAPEVGIYQVRDERVVRSQMFHADSAAVL